MNSPTLKSVAVVVALTDPATLAFGARLARFAEEVGPSGEVLLVDASGSPESARLVEGWKNVRLLSAPAGRLAPHLWRDGLIATNAEIIAFTTAHMTPCLGWLSALKAQLLRTDAAGVGGPIAPGSNLSATDRAVALLRYANYFPEASSSTLDKTDPPGDNALYHRELLMAVEPAWLEGFWEVGVHEALRNRGETLSMAASAVVTFEGGVGLASMIRQRLRHGWRYGAGRSRGLSLPVRLARVVATPLVPPLLCGRILRVLRARKMALRPWAPALPGLVLLAVAWAAGEALGTLFRTARSPSDSRTRDLVTQLT